MAPFRGLFEPVPLDGRSVLDPSILFAMLVYGIVALALSGLIGWLTDRILELRAGLTRHGPSRLITAACFGITRVAGSAPDHSEHVTTSHLLRRENSRVSENTCRSHPSRPADDIALRRQP